MPIPLDATGFEKEDDAHTSQRPLPGQYHAVVTEVDDTFEKYDKIIVTFKVLAGTVNGQEDKEQVEYFACTEKALPRLSMLALAIGLLKPGERKDIDFNEAIGRELIIVLDENTGQDGKNYINITWDGIWSLDNPEVANVPRAEATNPEEKLTMAQLGGDEPVASDTAGGGDDSDDWDL